jgi:hypothetical protein
LDCALAHDQGENVTIADQIKTLENETDLAIANARPMGERQVCDLCAL